MNFRPLVLLASLGLAPALLHCGGAADTSGASAPEQVSASLLVGDTFDAAGKPFSKRVGAEVHQNVQLLQFQPGGCGTDVETGTRCSGPYVSPAPFRIRALACDDTLCDVSDVGRECDVSGCVISIVPRAARVKLTIVGQSEPSNAGAPSHEATAVVEIDSAP